MNAVELRRPSLDQEHARIRENILRMGSLLESGITGVIGSEHRSTSGALIEANQRTAHLLERIERHGLIVLATKHPAARDLRRIIAAMHIAHELAQSSEHCCEISLLLTSDDRTPEMQVLQKMQVHLAKMLHDSMDAYLREDERMAVEIAEKDAVLDEAKAGLIRMLLSGGEPRQSAEHILRSYWSAHYFERIGDRVVNICERIVFQATGRLTDASFPQLLGRE